MNHPAKVLVVEDDETLREVLTEVLTARGLEVVASERGDKAVEIARRERFDLIIADIRMEGMNGLDTIEATRELQPDIGSIVVSGFASEEETLRAVRLNVAGYLKKPFQVPELMELINSYLTQRQERNRRLEEQRGLREALFWSLEQQGIWAEKSLPGEVLRPARLAGQLAQELGFAGDLGRQTFLGTLLRRLQDLGGDQPGPDAVSALEPYGTLLTAWREATGASPASFAVELCQNLSLDQEWPSPDSLQHGDQVLQDAYRRVLDKGEQTEPQPEPQDANHNAPAGLLALARTLEHGGDLDGARTAFERVVAESGISQLSLAALLGLARVAMAQGATAPLEKSMSELLALAEKLGPVSFATAELEGAKILQRTGHPAARKLLTRAVNSLARVNLTIPWATATVGQASLMVLDEAGTAQLTRALELLSQPQHQQEVIEHLDALIPAVLALAEITAAAPLASQLVRDYPHEVVSQLANNRLGLAARTQLVSLLETQGHSVPEALLDLLRRDPEPEIRSRGVALRATLGRSESLPVLRVHSLGQMEVTLGDQRLDDRVWKTQKTRNLFARLADHWPRPISVDKIMTELWPDSDEVSARNNLNAAVSNIRKNLRSTSKGFDPLLRAGDTLGLNPEQPFWHDVKELELASEQGKRALETGNVEAAMSHFGRVVRLYRGAYLEGTYLDWASQRQMVLENMAIEAFSRLADHRADQHRYREALECALRLMLLQPDHARAHEVAMSSYLGLEQHDKAVAHYEAHRTRLEQELDEEAAVALTKLYHMARYGFVQEPGFNPGP